MAVRLRADAERNRLALLAAAREVFGEQGLEASLDEIARRARVGNATLYRRFPTRADLISAVFADRRAVHVELAERALEDPDPWHGFVGFVTAMCELQAQNRGLGELLMSANFDGDDHHVQVRARSEQRIRDVIKRAQDAGSLRADYRLQDLLSLFMANAGVIQQNPDPEAWRRQLTLVIEGLSA